SGGGSDVAERRDSGPAVTGGSPSMRRAAVTIGVLGIVVWLGTGPAAQAVNRGNPDGLPLRAYQAADHADGLARPAYQQSPVASHQAPLPVTAADQTAMVKQYCATCHSDRGKAGGLSLASF